jgi:hypothetical protein
VLSPPPPAQVSPEVHSAPEPEGAFVADPTHSSTGIIHAHAESLSTAAVAAAAASANFYMMEDLISSASHVIPREAFYSHQELAQGHLHRTSSMPASPLASAPACPHGMVGSVPQFPAPNDTFNMVMESASILPLQGRLIHHHHHHHHGMYGQAVNTYMINTGDVVAPQPLSQPPRLAALSGAGL